MADFMDNLNERQREAVLETEGYVRVIAGAGSGKTKLLVSRYAYLVQDYGIDSSNILCVTFTNKAAGEMKKRIRGLIGEDNDVSLICTYHGFCNRLLRENPEKLFLNKQFQIIDAGQQKAILGEIYQKMELKLDYATFEAILRKIGRAKKDMRYVARMCNPRPCQILDGIKNQDDQIIEEFLQRQKAAYLLDFHDLIAFATYLLVTDMEVREKWQERLNYIMVDEFQDSSLVEMRLVEILSGMYRNLMIVGDPDQNIYEWRGSDVKLLVDFDKEHAPTRTIILNQNYRSTPQILQCANTLIEKNELRLKKDLFTKNPAGAPVVHYHSKDDFEEMDQVIANIKKLQQKEGFRYSDFAIIYRAGFLSRVAEKKLVEKNIPYEIFGGVRFYQRMEILDILAYLKLIAYDDDASFRRIVNTPRRRFGRAKMNLLEKLREREGQEYGNYAASLFATLAGNLDEKEFQGSDVGDFVRFIQAMRRNCQERRISDIVNEVTSETGYEAYIRELGDEERLDNLAEFKRLSNEFEREFGENVSLEGFLQQIALQSGEDSGEDRDTVKLMTIHSAKGLEFPAVFILGFTEGVFPSAKTMGDRKKLGLEEERRLCYVAITRAEKYLFLMESEGTSTGGMKKLVSRFLEEIGEKNYVRIGRISEELRRESRGYAARLNREMQSEPVDESKAVGDTVEHHVFGRGTILAIDEKRGSYSIKFDKLQFPRNISSGYFRKTHVDLRQGAGEGKTEEAGNRSHAEEPEPARARRPEAPGEKAGAEMPTEESGSGLSRRPEAPGERAGAEMPTEESSSGLSRRPEASGEKASAEMQIEESSSGLSRRPEAPGERAGAEMPTEESGSGLSRRPEASGEKASAEMQIEESRSGLEEGPEASGESVRKFQLEGRREPEERYQITGKMAVPKGNRIVGEKVGQTESDLYSAREKQDEEFPESELPEARNGKHPKSEVEGTWNTECAESEPSEAWNKECAESEAEGTWNTECAESEPSEARNGKRPKSEAEGTWNTECAESEPAEARNGKHPKSEAEEAWNTECAESEPSEAWNAEYPETESAETEHPGNGSARRPKADSPNLWKREDVPHSGWHCVGVVDLGAPVGICQMCGYQIIRYAHQMEHPQYGHLSVGCVCAGRMEGDPEAAKRREAEFKNKESRRLRFSGRKWKQSHKGNEYLKIDGHVVVLYQCSKNAQFSQGAQAGNNRGDAGGGTSVWKYAIDNAFCRTAYTTREKAVSGAFDALEELRKK